MYGKFLISDLHQNYRNDSRTKHKREEKTTNFFKSEKKAENQINEPL